MDGRSFYSSYKEIFERGIYRFETESAAPCIVDGGANIGLSVIYFKRAYPSSRIVAFEPDPALFRVLRENVAAFGLSDVRLVDKALWGADAEAAFLPEGADAGRLAAEADRGRDGAITVPAERLAAHLAGRTVDMLKLDIEGAETEALLDAAAELGNVRNVFVEYHSFSAREQRLDELLRALRGAGFRVQIHTQYASPQPLARREEQLGMDLQLNIFGYRGGAGARGTGK